LLGKSYAGRGKGRARQRPAKAMPSSAWLSEAKALPGAEKLGRAGAWQSYAEHSKGYAKQGSA